MDNVADVTISGPTAGENFGISVSSAGDVNGDGFPDVIVGASFNNSETGRAYIYFGGVSMNNVADVIMSGESISSKFGFSVSTAGDVNGDGFSDVIVGADDFNNITGRAYIFFGGVSMNNAADIFMNGEAVGDNFGISVSSAGDVNQDGYYDVIVGSNRNDSSATNGGRAYIFLGGASMNNNVDVVLNAEAAGNEFGGSVSSAGDVNKDGYSDVIVGAYGYNSFMGRVYIYYGGASMNNTADITMTGESAGIQLGRSVSTAGDINGDGYSDVIIGAIGHITLTGKAFIFLGGSSMNNVADISMTGESTSNTFGNSVSALGDINGDGYTDFGCGASGFNTLTGRTYVFLGSAISVKPMLLFVKDVPNDQGGKVNLKWARSGFDINGSNLVTGYNIYRSFPPIGGNYAWQFISTLPADHFPFYSYVDNTPFDSTSNGSGNFFYRIKAGTSDPDVYWFSNILNGRSVDNIPPLVVQSFSAMAALDDVRLSWNRNHETDLYNYIIYRSTSPSIDPETEIPFATVTDSTYLDTSPLSGIYYYFIVAQDVHNNKSPVSVAESPGITLDLTMFIEGFYNAATNSQVSDTIKVYLRNNTFPHNIVDSSRAITSTAGNSVLKFSNAPNGTYYLVLAHRNSIETWSVNSISMTSGNSTSYNFSNSIAQAFGSNMKQVDSSPLRFAIYNADVNQDGFVDATDAGAIDNDAFNFVTGYVNTDLTGDDIVDASDAAIADNNAFNFVSKVTP